MALTTEDGGGVGRNQGDTARNTCEQTSIHIYARLGVLYTHYARTRTRGGGLSPQQGLLKVPGVALYVGHCCLGTQTRGLPSTGRAVLRGLPSTGRAVLRGRFSTGEHDLHGDCWSGAQLAGLNERRRVRLGRSGGTAARTRRHCLGLVLLLALPAPHAGLGLTVYYCYIFEKIILSVNLFN